MALHATTESASVADLALTTTDLWKAAGLLLILADHVGLYLDPENLWWRVVGRAALPIFFFFIGYAKSRDVPLRWLAIGAGLMALGYWLDGGFEANGLNILFGFAAIRIGLRGVDWLLALPLLRDASQLLQLAFWTLMIWLLLLAMPYADRLFEYGTEGAILALAGLAVRRATDAGTKEAKRLAIFVMLLAGSIYVAAEWVDFGLDLRQGLALAAVVTCICLLLLRFQRSDAAWQPGEAMRRALAFCGRHSLELYALQIVVLAPLGAWLEDDQE
ncbi:MAG: TraX family protein [Bosea sp. (in: a-proteobacteria)]